MKKLIVLASFSFLLIGCDRTSDFYFRIQNNLQDKTISVFAQIEHNSYNSDIAANSTMEIYHMNSGLSQYAEDVFSDTIWIIDSICVFRMVVENPVNSEFNYRLRSEWSYQNEDDWTGIYTLIIDTVDFPEVSIQPLDKLSNCRNSQYFCR